MGTRIGGIPELVAEALPASCASRAMCHPWLEPLCALLKRSLSPLHMLGCRKSAFLCSRIAGEIHESARNAI